MTQVVGRRDKRPIRAHTLTGHWPVAMASQQESRRVGRVAKAVVSDRPQWVWADRVVEPDDRLAESEARACL